MKCHQYIRSIAIVLLYALQVVTAIGFVGMPQSMHINQQQQQQQQQQYHHQRRHQQQHAQLAVAQHQAQQPQQQQQTNQAAATLPKINLYINKQETWKLLALRDQNIYYVQDGRRNDYALSFFIPLETNQSDIHFTWSNQGTTNVSYAISLVISNMDVVKPPLINITRQGFIPRQEQVFRLTLPCSGLASAEVDIQILINITGFLEDDSSLTLDSTESTNADSITSSDVATDAMLNDQADGSSIIDDNSDNNNSQHSTTSASSDSVISSASTRTKISKQPVSTTLSIKRKKICFVHPVAVTGPAIPAPTKTQPMAIATSTPTSGSNNNNSSSTNESTQGLAHDQDHSVGGNKQLIGNKQSDNSLNQQQQTSVTNSDSKQQNSEQQQESGATSDASAPIDQSTLGRDGQQTTTTTTTTNQQPQVPLGAGQQEHDSSAGGRGAVGKQQLKTNHLPGGASLQSVQGGMLLGLASSSWPLSVAGPGAFSPSAAASGAGNNNMRDILGPKWQMNWPDTSNNDKETDLTVHIPARPPWLGYSSGEPHRHATSKKKEPFDKKHMMTLDFASSQVTNTSNNNSGSSSVLMALIVVMLLAVTIVTGLIITMVKSRKHLPLKLHTIAEFFLSPGSSHRHGNHTHNNNHGSNNLKSRSLPTATMITSKSSSCASSSSTSSTSALSNVSGKSLTKSSFYHTNNNNCGYYGSAAYHNYQHPPTGDLLGVNYTSNVCHQTTTISPQQLLQQQQHHQHHQQQLNHRTLHNLNYPHYNLNVTQQQQQPQPMGTTLIWSQQGNNNININHSDPFTCDGSYTPLAPPPPSTDSGSYASIY